MSNRNSQIIPQYLPMPGQNPPPNYPVQPASPYETTPMQLQMPRPAPFQQLPSNPNLVPLSPPLSYSPTPYSISPQPNYFSPFPEPSHHQPEFVHLAPANIQPLYLSQFMFIPQQELVQQEIPVNEAGNIVIDVPLSSQVIKDAKYADEAEFTNLRYTPVTCEPNKFADNYKLRASELKRETKIAIVCTMYNEDEELFCKSMTAVFENVRSFCEYYKDPEWWKHIVVVIVSDGRTKINPRTLTVLAAMGCYADGLIQEAINGSPVTAHLFEFTPQLCIDRNGRTLTVGKNRLAPVQTIFLLKEKNAKKINSHRWFFNAICKDLKPDVCMLLDVGTKPTPQSFLKLWLAFERDPLCGGACGEIAAELDNWCKNLFNPLIGAQNFEYKMSNILDKPLESVAGFIAVLPGAFSAYRYKAIQGAPLDAYFKGETMHGEASVAQANMYLAEDRILCFEIVAKRNERWLLKYVKDAKAETDVPDRLPELISQRRRWLNGSFFAAVHALNNWYRIYTSAHSLSRKLMFSFQFLYNLLSLLFTWFSVGNFYLAFYFLFDVRDDTGLFKAAGPTLSEVLKAVYLFLIMCTLIASLGNRPQGSKWLFTSIVVFFAVIMALMYAVGIYAIIIEAQKYAGVGGDFFSYASRNTAFRDLVISLLVTYGVYLLSSIIHLDPWHCFTSMPSYMMILPSYVNILMIYAFCNIHDTTWGTKGDNGPPKTEGAKVTTNAEGQKIAEITLPSNDKKDVDAAYAAVLNQLKSNAIHKPVNKQRRDAATKQQDYFRGYRTHLVISWFTSNAILIYVFTKNSIVEAMFRTKVGDVTVNPYLSFIFWSVAAFGIIRFVFSTIYVLQFTGHKMRFCCARPRKPERRSLV